MPIPALPGPRPARSEGDQYHVCFVCTGNICRSPVAEVVLRHLATSTELPGGGVLSDRLVASSAGTGPWHVDEPMDPRASSALRERGLTDHGHRARQIDVSWTAGIDLMVCLDRHHAEMLRRLVPADFARDRLVLLRAFDPDAGGSLDIADPYYGEQADFDGSVAAIEAACRGLARALAETLGSTAATA